MVAARVGILRQYEHSDVPIPKTSTPVASEGTQRVNPKWLECCWLPSPQQSETSEQLRQVCVQQLTSAWSCLIGIEGYGYDLPVGPCRLLWNSADAKPFKELLLLPNSASEGWLHPLQVSRLDPPRLHAGTMQMLTKRFQHIPMNAPHWAHVFTILLSSYVLMMTDGEAAPPGLQPLRAPSQLWEMMKKWLVAYIAHVDVEIANRRIEVAARIISDILVWSDDVIESRSETRQGWYSGAAFMNLLEFWIDLSRKVSSPRPALLTWSEPKTIVCSPGSISHDWNFGYCSKHCVWIGGRR